MEKKTLPGDEQREDLLEKLRNRFMENAGRHPALEWSQLLERLTGQPDKIKTLHEMERTGGEPDVIGYDPFTGEFVFGDCCAETPADRRSLCYDDEALAARKDSKPRGSALGLAGSMGVELMDEDQYRMLQQLGSFDTKTSSWLKTPDDVRALGGALFGDRRYGRVFIYHNGAESYYGVRGFRGILRV